MVNMHSSTCAAVCAVRLYYPWFTGAPEHDAPLHMPHFAGAHAHAARTPHVCWAFGLGSVLSTAPLFTAGFGWTVCCLNRRTPCLQAARCSLFHAHLLNHADGWRALERQKNVDVFRRCICGGRRHQAPWAASPSASLARHRVRHADSPHMARLWPLGSPPLRESGIPLNSARAFSCSRTLISRATFSCNAHARGASQVRHDLFIAHDARACALQARERLPSPPFSLSLRSPYLSITPAANCLLPLR